MPTPFQEKVLQEVKKIPKGKTASYKEIAIRAGRPNAARAVGSVMANNYRDDVPCHRVICSNGKIGGYNKKGTNAKRDLLEKEKHTSPFNQ